MKGMSQPFRSQQLEESENAARRGSIKAYMEGAARMVPESAY
jgi:hypothetical protein